ncbi:pterin 4 alpha carbinolamine dehydratase [Diaporthe amygdali]|uniref:pterin 4 alpha carbinolamine dehydratase n=1 Tax=Phomopsis amygdali TaxID=1214568 RepID=UPI0022FF409D|nr:pterin 4 alpha carbinolamine dehydratase [Diaporthe amygdali]KAJ0117962.1 pterin 4 alpha carbinolamine dehydratase [Diaporthe amygdali]
MAAASPKFSEGSDEPRLTQELDSLLSRWTLTTDGQGIERSFKFKTFAKTWDFMTAVSLQCKIKNHHPEWSNVYNTTFIRWTTHSPRGLSAKDTELAAICDEYAQSFGEVQETAAAPAAAPAGDGQSCQLKGLADHVASASGDCCTPKKSS